MCPRFYQRAEGSPVAHSVVEGDPSLRLKTGCAQDDAIDDEHWASRYALANSAAAASRLFCFTLLLRAARSFRNDFASL